MTDCDSPPWLTPRAAYLHIPFCGHHCGYCNFAVTAGQDHLINLYLEALEVELSRLGEPQPVSTIFMGGGTPTYLSPQQLERLLTAIAKWLPLVNDPDDGRPPEFTIESTPESITPEKVEVLAGFGVNRASIGVQSFHPHLLTALDRRHGVGQIGAAVDAVRRRIPSLSFDLIFGAPGQTAAEWDADLSAALAYDPDHISTYGLTYEKGTPLWKDRERGRVRPLTEDQELDLYLAAIDRLTAAGFGHYEISNFARPGSECRHNLRYWANHAYRGFGVGAARYVGGSRELNVRNTQDYIRRVLAGDDPTFQRERLDPRDRALETVAVQLRRAQGVSRPAFRGQTEFGLDELVGECVAVQVANGLLADDGERVWLTRQGKCVADAVIEALFK